MKQGEDILVSRMPDPIGRACISPIFEYPYIVAVDISIVKVNDNIEKKFLLYFLNKESTLQKMKLLATGATRQRISRKKLETIRVPMPPLREQQKIADILSKVDEQIDLTEKIIDKTEELKKGLMQNLLTKGVGHTEFKETELGMIPKEWEIIKTEKQIELSTGFAFKSSEYSENNIDHKLLRGANITRGKLRWKKEITKFWEYTPDFENFLLEENDIVIGMDGSLVGRNSAIITKKDLPLLLVQRVARLKTKDGLNPKYLFYHIDNGRFIKYVDTVKTNTGIPHISGKNIQNYKITFPPIGEQNRIASILSKVDEHIQDNKKELKHLQEVKKGLMQDLLTGKVRVSV